MNDKAIFVIAQLAEYFWSEMGWENFRAEFMSHREDRKYSTVRQQNAAQICEFMQGCAEKFPDFEEALLRPSKILAMWQLKETLKQLGSK